MWRFIFCLFLIVGLIGVVIEAMFAFLYGILVYFLLPLFALFLVTFFVKRWLNSEPLASSHISDDAIELSELESPPEGFFGRVALFFRNIRINWDFPRYDRVQRKKHLDEAESKFSTSSLSSKRESILRAIESEYTAKFGRTIEALEADEKGIENEVAAKEALISLFSLDYKKEIDMRYAAKHELIAKKRELHDEVKGLRDELSSAYEEKDAANSELEKQKQNVASWHAKSQRSSLLFGSAGKKLPKHSLFGQSFGDLDAYKYDRDKAWKRVSEIKSKIEDLKNKRNAAYVSIDEVRKEIGDVQQKINKLKSDRSEMFALKKKGHSRTILMQDLKCLRVRLASVARLTDDARKAKQEFTRSEMSVRGVDKIDRHISDLKKEKKRFIEAFDKEENRQARRLKHRKAWLIAQHVKKGYIRISQSLEPPACLI